MKRKYKTEKQRTPRKDGTASIARLPCDWLKAGERYGLLYHENQILINQYGSSLCRPAGRYVQFLVEWDAGTVYEAENLGGQVLLEKI